MPAPAVSCLLCAHQSVPAALRVPDYPTSMVQPIRPRSDAGSDEPRKRILTRVRRFTISDIGDTVYGLDRSPVSISHDRALFAHKIIYRHLPPFTKSTSNVSYEFCGKWRSVERPRSQPCRASKECMRALNRLRKVRTPGNGCSNVLCPPT